MYGYIYLTTNLINGKKYIGQKTSNKFLGESYLGSGKLLQRAVSKYGKDNFTVKLLESCESKEELDRLEIQYISKYRELGYDLYNIANGGYTTGGCLGNTTKGKIWVNNGTQHKMIERKDLSRYLNKGYVQGSLNTKNYIWVTNGKTTSHIPPTLLDEYLSRGYKKGRGSTHKMWITNGVEDKYISVEDPIPEGYVRGRCNKGKQPSKNKKYMYKNEDEILVNPNQIEFYLQQGYKLGKHPRSSIKGTPGNKYNKGKKWLTDGTNNVLTQEFDKYIKLGYYFGRTYNPHSK